MTATLFHNPYAAYIRSSLLGMLAYRLRYFTGILTYLLYVSIQYFIWQAIYSGHPAASGEELVLNGYTLAQMITYVTVAWIARSLCFSNIDWDIDEIVRTGQISVYLMRPVNFQLLMLSQAFGELLFRFVFFTIPIALVIGWLFPILAPANAVSFIWFCWSTLVGFLVMAQLNFLVGLAAFYLKSIISIIQAKHYLLQLLSGLLLPLSFFPSWAEAILKVLPFQMLTFIPMEFYLGKVDPSDYWKILLQQIFWISALALSGQLLWSRATSRLVVQGG